MDEFLPHLYYAKWVGLVLALLLLLTPSSAWWDASWTYKSIVSVTETAGLARTNETITVNMSTISGFTRNQAQSGCADIRTVNYTSQTEMAFTNTTCNANDILVELPCRASASATNFQCAELYWGNGAAGSPTTENSLSTAIVGGGLETAGTYVQYGQMESKLIDSYTADSCGITKNCGNPLKPVFGNVTGMSMYQGTGASPGLDMRSGATGGLWTVNKSTTGLFSAKFNMQVSTTTTRNLTYYDTGKVFENDTFSGTTPAAYRSPELSNWRGFDYTCFKYSGTYGLETTGSLEGPIASGLNYFCTYNSTSQEYVAWILVGNNTAVGYNDEGGLWYPTTQSLANPSTQYLIVYGHSASGSLQSVLDAEYTKARYPLTVSAGAATSPPSASVTIHDPQNKTYWQSSVPLIFSYNDTSQTTAACTRQLDGVYTAIGNVTNDTAYSSILVGLSVGGHALSIICQTSQGNKTASAAFTTQSHALVLQESPAVVYETNSTYFTLQLNQSNYIDTIDANLTWNSTSYPASSTNTTSVYTFTHTHTPPLLQQNNTQIDWRWSYQITLVNGTKITNTTPMQTQNVTFSSWINSVSSDRAQYIESETTYISLNITDRIGTASLRALLFFANRTANTTSYTAATGYKIFTLPFYTSQLPGNATDETHAFWGNLSVAFGGNTRTWQQSNNQTINVSRIYLIVCNATYSTKTLKLNAKTEETNAAINASIDTLITARVGGGTMTRTYAWELRSNSTYYICIYPAWAEYKADSIFQYWAGSYSLRNYFLTNATLNNITKETDLFLLDSSLSTPIIIYVKDENENPVQDVTVKARRFFVGQDAYLAVGMVKTDYEGKGVTYLRINEIWYSFTLEKNGQTIAEYPPAPVTCTSSPCTMLFKTAPSQAEIWTVLGKLSYSCSSNSTSKTIRCTVGDGTGIMSLAMLNVTKQMPLSNEHVCQSTASSSSVTLVCDFDDNSTGQYAYTLDALVNGITYHLHADILNWGQALVWGGSLGLISTFLITATLAFVAINSPAAAIVFSLVGLLISWALQLYSAGFGVLMGLIISIIVIIYKMRS